MDVSGFIFDVDGVLEYQCKPYNGAIETIESLRERGFILRFLTNSTLKSRKSCTNKLKNIGFNIYLDEVITASYATAIYLKGINPRSCWIMLEREGVEEFSNFIQDSENPEYIVMGDYRSNFNFDNMNKALRLLIKGSKFVVMIPELIDSSLGEIELNVGSWGKMLEKASNVEAIYIGKPNRYMFDLTLKSMNLDKSEIIMVGDTVSTDIQGAKNVGIRSILLRTGEFNENDLTKNIRPDFILNSVQEILNLVI